MMHLSFDTETTGLDLRRDARMFAFSTCTWNGVTGVYRNDGPASRRAAYRKRLEVIWAPENRHTIRKGCHNVRFDGLGTMEELGIPLAEMRLHDVDETMALSHLYNNRHKTHALEDIGWELFKFPRDLDAAVKKYKNMPGAMLNCPEWLCRKYQIADAKRTMLALRGLSKKVKEMGLWHIYEMELALIWTTLAIEARGIMVSEKRVNALVAWMEERAEKAQEEFQAIVGKQIALNDNNVRRVLYRTLGLPVLKKTPAGLPSVDKYVLKELKEKTGHPIFDCIMKYRSYSRTKLIRGYLDHADANGIIHPSIHPYKADTGRESITKPSLQNVERDDRLINPYPIPARRCFGPEPGHVNYHLDYEGFQARIFTHRSGDPEFTKIFMEGGDPHEEASKEFYGEKFTRIDRRKQAKLWKEMRDAGKNGDFCVAFGGGIQSLAQTLAISREDAAQGMRRFKSRFSELSTLNIRDAKHVRENGYIVTAFGRILRVPRNKAYMGTVYGVQGDEAGAMKRAQIRVDDYLEKATGGEVGIILPIHDEFIIKCPRERIADFEGDLLPGIRERMIDFPEFSVPLEIEAKVSISDWTKKKPVTIRET